MVEALFDLADSTWQEGTSQENFQERWGKLWKFAASLTTEEQKTVLTRGQMMKIRKTFVKKPGEGCSLLDSAIREVQSHVKAKYADK